MVIELEWSTIWSEIIRVTARDCARVRFEIKSMISDQNCAVQLPLYYSHFDIAEFSQYQSDGTYLMASLLKHGNKKPFISHFVFETEMMQYRTKIRMMRFVTDVI